MKPNGVLCIAGATATGKSALAIGVAERVGGEVISADAFAAYRGMDVGTAKPTPEERWRVPHHLIDVKNPDEPYSAGEFATRARAIADDVLSRGKLPILCGGTGFYVRSFFEGLFEGPTRDPRLRAALAAVTERRGRAFLKRMVEVLDPAVSDRVLPGDAVKATRLLEILLTSGRRVSELYATRPGPRWERAAVKLLLVLPRPMLYERISARFSRKFETSFPEEVRRLLEAGWAVSAPGFAAIGYRDTVELVRGGIDQEEWRERVLRATRRFAKRQETWFRKETGLVEVRADRPDLIDFTLAEARPLFSGSERGKR